LWSFATFFLHCCKRFNVKLSNTLSPSLWVKLGCSLALLVGLSAGASAQAAEVRFTFSANGAEVFDAKTGLTWQRCSLGQTWTDGTCKGSASKQSFKQATTMTKIKGGWRLPTVKELATLVDTGRGIPAIDLGAFPAAPADWYCTSSPYLGSASLAWYVDFQHGDSSPLNRDQRHHIRLVR
jgi:hypothetical protein